MTTKVTKGLIDPIGFRELLIDSKLIVPLGGTTGQVLAKASDADNEVKWTNEGAGDVIAVNNLSDLENVATARTNLGSFDTAMDALGARIPPVLNFFRTAGHRYPGDGGGALYKRVPEAPAHAASLQSADGAWWEIADPILTPIMVGAVGDGVTDDTAPLNHFTHAVTLLNRRGLIPPKRYKINDTVYFPINIVPGPPNYGLGQKVILIEAYGAVFDARDASIAFLVTGWGSGNKLIWRGGVLEQYGSAVSNRGWQIQKNGHFDLEDMVFVGGRAAGQPLVTGYSAIQIQQEDQNVPDTGAFWTTIRGCIFTTTVGDADLSDRLPAAITLRGAANATKVLNCQFNNLNRCISIIPSETGYMPNGCLFQQNDFEKAAYVFIINGRSIGRSPGGLRANNNRVEGISAAFFSITLTIGEPIGATPPSIRDNYFESATGTIISNPDNRFIDADTVFTRQEGIATFAGVTSVVVPFPDNTWGILSGSNYRVEIEVPNGNRWWVAGKGQNQFTINTDTAYTGNVAWGVSRRG